MSRKVVPEINMADENMLKYARLLLLVLLLQLINDNEISFDYMIPETENKTEHVLNRYQTPSSAQYLAQQCYAYSQYNTVLVTHKDERMVLYKTKSLDGTKPNTNPKTNPNPKLT